jgi:hypothetical protein
VETHGSSRQPEPTQSLSYILPRHNHKQAPIAEGLTPGVTRAPRQRT